MAGLEIAVVRLGAARICPQAPPAAFDALGDPSRQQAWRPVGLVLAGSDRRLAMIPLDAPFLAVGGPRRAVA